MTAKSALLPRFRPVLDRLMGDPARVVWAETRNMLEGAPWRGDDRPVDWRAAAAEMDDHAVVRSLGKPVYHVTVWFAPEDDPAEPVVRSVADRVLADLGLGGDGLGGPGVEEYQAVLVRHPDDATLGGGPYEAEAPGRAHVHVVANRVGHVWGEDGAGRSCVWSPWRDRVKLRTSMEALEREHGLRATGRNAAVDAALDGGPDGGPDGDAS